MADMTGALRLEVSYYPWSTSEARNGDTFSVRIYDASEKMVFLYRDQPELTEIYPNGPSCPPRCMQARVDWTPTR